MVRKWTTAQAIVGFLKNQFVARDGCKPDLRFARAEVSGDLLLDMAVHDFNLARWMMGSEAGRVSVESSALLYPTSKPPETLTTRP